MTSEKADTRRRSSTMTKAQVVAQCAEAGASVAKIAMAHGINANVVHRWRKLARGGDANVALKTGEFIALPLTMAPRRCRPPHRHLRCRTCRSNCAAARSRCPSPVRPALQPSSPCGPARCSGDSCGCCVACL
jgi:transposase-like protein